MTPGDEAGAQSDARWRGDELARLRGHAGTCEASGAITETEAYPDVDELKAIIGHALGSGAFGNVMALRALEQLGALARPHAPRADPLLERLLDYQAAGFHEHHARRRAYEGLADLPLSDEPRRV